MCKLVFDEVRAQLEHFVKDGTRHCAITAAAQFILGNSVKMMLDGYARWLPSKDKGSAKAMMIEAMNNRDSSQVRPKEKTG